MITVKLLCPKDPLGDRRIDFEMIRELEDGKEAVYTHIDPVVMTRVLDGYYHIDINALMDLLIEEFKRKRERGF